MTATHCEDQKMFDDADAVAFAAGVLNISEFKLFEIAYENWFGNKATEKAMSGIFGSYLKSGSVGYKNQKKTNTDQFSLRFGELFL
jgi:hypothetical protein